MRRLARELRAGAMSLYHYFDSRDELLDLMGDAVAAEMLVPGELPRDWREALTRDRAAQPRGTFLAHPWMLLDAPGAPAGEPEPAAPHRAVGPARSSPLGEAGVARQLLNGIVTAVDDYTIGYTLRELAAGGSDDERGRRIAARFAESSTTRTSATCSRAASSRCSRSSSPAASRCRCRASRSGSNWLLDGFAADSPIT